jgi:hypothetical protein
MHRRAESIAMSYAYFFFQNSEIKLKSWKCFLLYNTGIRFCNNQAMLNSTVEVWGGGFEREIVISKGI